MQMISRRLDSILSFLNSAAVTAGSLISCNCSVGLTGVRKYMSHSRIQPEGQENFLRSCAEHHGGFVSSHDSYRDSGSQDILSFALLYLFMVTSKNRFLEATSCNQALRKTSRKHRPNIYSLFFRTSAGVILPSFLTRIAVIT